MELKLYSACFGGGYQDESGFVGNTNFRNIVQRVYDILRLSAPQKKGVDYQGIPFLGYPMGAVYSFNLIPLIAKPNHRGSRIRQNYGLFYCSGFYVSDWQPVLYLFIG